MLRNRWPAWSAIRHPSPAPVSEGARGSSKDAPRAVSWRVPPHTRSRRIRYAAERIPHLVHVMAGGSRRQARAVGVVGGIHQTAHAAVGEPGLDARQIESKLV